MREIICPLLLAALPILVGVLIHEGYIWPAGGTVISWFVLSITLKW